MNREQLAHVLRAAATIADDGDILVIGSQAILATYDDDELPEEATLSVEVDVAFWHDPGVEKADRVDGAIGELSPFHDLHGYYGQGVSVSTAVLPTGWEDRVVAYRREDTGSSAAVCLDAHDLVVSKLVAGRDKDLTFATALLTAGLVNRGTLLERAGSLNVPEPMRARVRGHIERCAMGGPAPRSTDSPDSGAH
jgi:hypothetical protein